MPAAVRPLPHAASFQPAVALVTLVAPMPVIRAICLTVRCARLSLSRHASRSGRGRALSSAGSMLGRYQLGYDPFDICDAAPMLDIVGGSRRYCEHLKEVAGRIWSVEILPRRRILDEDALSVAREYALKLDQRYASRESIAPFTGLRWI